MQFNKAISFAWLYKPDNDFFSYKVYIFSLYFLCIYHIQPSGSISRTGLGSISIQIMVIIGMVFEWKPDHGFTYTMFVCLICSNVMPRP